MTDRNENETPKMQTERIEISGGRYLIYYTFPGMGAIADQAAENDDLHMPSPPDDDASG